MAYYPGREGRGGRGSGYGPGSLYTPGGLSAVTGRHHSVEDEKGKYHYGRNRPGGAWDRSSGVVGPPGSYMGSAIHSPRGLQGYAVPNQLASGNPLLNALRKPRPGKDAEFWNSLQKAMIVKAHLLNVQNQFDNWQAQQQRFPA